MIHIAICDNDVRDLTAVQECLMAALAQRKAADVDITAFASSAELCEKVRTGHAFDMYILDVLMPEMDGITLGRLVRSYNIDAPVIYTTSSREYALDAYGVHALGYLLKPVRPNDMDAALETAMRLLASREKHTAIVRGANDITNIVLDDVMYVSNDVRTATYTLRDGTTVEGVRSNGTFEDAIAPIPSMPEFVQTHKSFFINMKYVRVMKPESVIMDDDRVIPVNRRRRAQVRSAYMNFVACGGNIR